LAQASARLFKYGGIGRKMFVCSLPNCPDGSEKSFNDFLNHLSSRHFQNELSEELKNFQVLK
jgi:hypothetical protein